MPGAVLGDEVVAEALHRERAALLGGHQAAVEERLRLDHCRGRQRDRLGGRSISSSWTPKAATPLRWSVIIPSISAGGGGDHGDEVAARAPQLGEAALGELDLPAVGHPEAGDAEVDDVRRAGRCRCRRRDGVVRLRAAADATGATVRLGALLVGERRRSERARERRELGAGLGADAVGLGRVRGRAGRVGRVRRVLGGRTGAEVRRRARSASCRWSSGRRRSPRRRHPGRSHRRARSSRPRRRPRLRSWSCRAGPHRPGPA